MSLPEFRKAEKHMKIFNPTIHDCNKNKKNVYG